MSGKPSLKNLTIDEILEALCLYDNFLEDIDLILGDISRNEDLDHQNDKLRHEAIGFLLTGLKYTAIPDGTSANMHAALQKLHSADGLDFGDDKPRAEARLKLSLLREKAFNNRQILEGMLSIFGGRKDAGIAAK